MPRNSTKGQLARRLAIVNILPRLTASGTERGMTVEQVMAHVGPEFGVDRRTFERDMQELADEFGDWRRMGLHVTGRQAAHDRRAREWFTTASSRILLFRTLTPTDALIAGFARQELGPLLPQEARESLDGQLALIEQKLQHLQLTHGHRQGLAYRDRIRRLPDSTPLTSARVKPAHLQAVNDALMQNAMLRIMYRAARHDTLKEHRVHPVGLVIHDRSLRLLAVDERQLTLAAPDMVIKSFLLHRMQAVADAGPSPGGTGVPTLDQALAGGALAAWSRGQISLRLEFADSEDGYVFARTLEEMPLAEDQKLYRNASGRQELTATVENTSALRRMLQGMAREARVVEPADLRDEMHRFLRDGIDFLLAGS